MIGTISGSWVVIENVGKDLWACKCRCGEEKTRSTHFLKYNKSKGCLLCQRNEEHQSLLNSLIGAKVGTWQVVSYEGNSKYGSRRWLCKCECGTEKSFCTSYLTGSHKRKASTCKACELRNLELNNRIVSDIPNRFWRKFLHSAGKRNLAVEIAKEQAFDIFQKQQASCALTGIGLHFTKLTSRYWRYTNASIDRIDSNKPYIVGNIQWLEKRINMMKQKYPQDEFIELCRMVAKHAEAN